MYLFILEKFNDISVLKVVGECLLLSMMLFALKARELWLIMSWILLELNGIEYLLSTIQTKQRIQSSVR